MSKCFWIPKYNWIGATGISKKGRNEIRFWDLRDVSKPLITTKMSQGGTLRAHFDNDNSLLYDWCRGDNVIHCRQVVNDDKVMHLLAAYRNPDIRECSRGGTFVPKRCLDVSKCEIARFLELRNSKCIVPVSFIVPRNNSHSVFQSDLYPKALSDEPSMTLKEYINGFNKEPKVMSLNPQDYLNWMFVRIIWIGFLKNDNNNTCLVNLLPKDVVKLILTFVGIHKKKKS